MGALISPPKPPKPPELPPIPDRSAIEAEERKKIKGEIQEKRQRQRGRAGTILTGSQGDDSFGLATKTLLGG